MSLQPIWADGTIATGLGLCLTLGGAAWSAFGVFLSDDEIRDATASYYSAANPKMQKALMQQTARAKWGLGFIALGTLIQIVGLCQHAMQIMC